MIATRRVYRTDSDELVDEHDPAAAYLVCIAGEEIPDRYTGRVPDHLVAPVDEPAEREKVDADHTPKHDDAGDGGGEKVERPEPPAKTASTAIWGHYAAAIGVAVPAGAKRADIIAAIEAAQP